MRVSLRITAKDDVLYLVRSSEFVRLLDQNDIMQRDSQVILDCYHPNWFDSEENSSYFYPPAVFFDSGRVKFINGRHRALLLVKYLDEIPIMLTKSDSHNFDMIKLIHGVRLTEGFFLEIPDLELNPNWHVCA